MKRKVILHHEAEAEIFGALDWYAARSALAARAFVQELTSMVVLASRAPEIWPRTLGDVRRIVFPRFPFDLVFRLKGDLIEIVALAHHRRRPRYWRNR